MNRLLIVEDHPGVRRLIRMTLDFAGHQDEVGEAVDGQAGTWLTRGTAVEMIATHGGAVDRLADIDAAQTAARASPSAR